MARSENGKSTTAVETRPRNATVASARKIPLNNRKLAKTSAAKRQDWQDESWEYFDDVPEIKYSTWFLGNAMSKLRIFAAVRNLDDPDGDPIPVEDPASGIPLAVATRARLEIERLKSPLGGQGEILRELNMNLEIAAEGYLVGIGPRSSMVDDLLSGEQVEMLTPEQWEIKSISEVGQKDGKYKISAEPNDQHPVTLDPEADTIIRIWQRHPRWSNLPDCNMRGVLSECEALMLLSNQVKGEAKSHQSAGILAVPNELSFGAPAPAAPEDGDEAEADPFIDALMDALIDPIEDPSSAAAVMPLVLRGPGDIIDKLKHITLTRDTAAVLEARIQARIERLARGLNLPVEVVMGHMNTTFANAGQVDEDTFEDHLEPRCVLLCDAITVGFLQPNLIDALVDPTIAERIIVWYDARALIGKVDPKVAADKGLELDVISGEAWRRVKGYSEDDAPTPQEMLVRAAIKLRTLDPTVSAAMLKLLGVPLDIEPLPTSTDQTVSPAAGIDVIGELMLALIRKGETGAITAALPAPAKVERNVGRKLMDIDRDLRSKLVLAADRAMTRALERAGNRLKARAGATKSVVKGVHPLYAAATLGPALVAQAGLTDDELVGDDSWDELHRQFDTWVTHAQRAALALAAATFGTIDPGELEDLARRQSSDAATAWEWFMGQLGSVAHEQLYAPDPHAVALGELDPTSRVPRGLVRQAIAIAGGATGIDPLAAADEYVAYDNGQPLGGIGTGDLVNGALRAAGGQIEAYEWVYGTGFRLHPFPDHEELDGLIFASFDGDSLAHGDAADWLPETSYFPGDHDGCDCDSAPVWVSIEDVGDISVGPNG